MLWACDNVRVEMVRFHKFWLEMDPVYCDYGPERITLPVGEQNYTFARDRGDVSVGINHQVYWRTNKANILAPVLHVSIYAGGSRGRHFSEELGDFPVGAIGVDIQGELCVENEFEIFERFSRHAPVISISEL